MTQPDNSSPGDAVSSYPVVRRPAPLLSTPAIVGLVTAFGLMLFVVLVLRRGSIEAPTTLPLTTSEVRPLPELSLPSSPYDLAPEAAPQLSPIPLPEAQPLLSAPRPRSVPPPPNDNLSSFFTPPYSNLPLGSPLAPPPNPPSAVTPPRATGGSAIVFDGTTGAPSPGQVQGQPQFARSNVDDPTAMASGSDRAHAGAFLNRSTTVAQGTIVPAVLETAFDSTGPGFARALVQRDVRGFDGTRVLIPRGSRVLGRYRATPTAGQNRVLIIWFRLVRPDGVTIELESPASDALGRGGVKAEVNSHFFERFAGAILQSALDVGVNLAARSADNSVVVALPGSVGAGRQLAQPNQIPPTLKIRAGKSVGIFVAKDLDFTGQE
jgi:type IV secretion system protein VirB10